MTDRGFGFQSNVRKFSIGAAAVLSVAATVGGLIAVVIILIVHAPQCDRNTQSVRVGNMLVAGCEAHTLTSAEARQ
jgi:hypothetical protein